MWTRTIATSLILLVSGPSGPQSPDRDWLAYQERFVQSDGRVVDSGNQGISHSEGQGYGMLLAEHFGDRPTFERLWGWTRNHLQVRPDRLFAWKWTPADGVTDLNNASDADLLLAWALLKGGRRWQSSEWLMASRAIRQDIRKRLVQPVAGETVLLPGEKGFVTQAGVTINLSYWIYPALEAFQAEDGQGAWGELMASGHRLLQKHRFGRWGLPPDWLLLGHSAQPAPGFAPRFGYDAVRIPLYLIWAKASPGDLLQPFQAFWRTFSPAPVLPAWTNLPDDSVDSHGASQGMRAIAGAVMAHPRAELAHLGTFEPGQDYYSVTLQLLCRVMLAERDRL